jgi:hypothetical protein
MPVMPSISSAAGSNGFASSSSCCCCGAVASFMGSALTSGASGSALGAAAAGWAASGSTSSPSYLEFVSIGLVVLRQLVCLLTGRRKDPRPLRPP